MSSTRTILCNSHGCGESRTIAAGAGGEPSPAILDELGWTRHAPNIFFCDLHSGRKLTDGDRLKLREEIDREIIDANQRVREAFATTLPTESAARKAIPIVRGFLDYFPAAAAAVAQLSFAGNEKHNPGEELHHARGKSTDHADCIVRHLMERGTVDPEDGIRHSVKVAWRALALLQEELEREENAPLARGARL